ncbi:MAG: hypothetical protein ACP5KV_04170 [Candidatus Methanomethylicaceae archaeon]
MVNIDAERIAEALKLSGGSVARRNKLIKKALVAEFGHGNVSVRGDRGTAYGWVSIKVKVKKPHNGKCDWRCRLCIDTRNKVTERVWRILEETGLDKELGTYYDDMGWERKEYTINVELV